MHDGGADLTFDVVADDRNLALLEAAAPLRIRCYEYRDAVYERAAGIECTLGVPFGSLLRAHREIGDHDIGASALKNFTDIRLRSIRFGNAFAQIFTQAIQCLPTLDPYPGPRGLCEPLRIIGFGIDGLRDVAADFSCAHVESG